MIAIEVSAVAGRSVAQSRQAGSTLASSTPSKNTEPPYSSAMGNSPNSTAVTIPR
jgi:hypothetical protein